MPFPGEFGLSSLSFLVLFFFTVLLRTLAGARLTLELTKGLLDSGIGRLGPPSSGSAPISFMNGLWASVFTICQMGVVMSFPCVGEQCTKVPARVPGRGVSRPWAGLL